MTFKRSTIVEVTASTQIKATGGEAVLWALHTQGVATTKWEIVDGGSGGTVVLSLEANTGVPIDVAFPNGVRFGDGIYARITGAAKPLSLSYE